MGHSVHVIVIGHFVTVIVIGLTVIACNCNFYEM